MQIGVAVPNAHETLAEPATIAAVARLAESLGFDSVWANDHVIIPAAAPSDAGEATPAYAARYGEQRRKKQRAKNKQRVQKQIRRLLGRERS